MKSKDHPTALAVPVKELFKKLSPNHGGIILYSACKTGVILGLIVFHHVTFGTESPPKGVTYSYNWQLHDKLIDEQFEKHCKDYVLEFERMFAKATFPEHVAKAYMRKFEMGMGSNTGIIMIEGGIERDLLQNAYFRGFLMKLIFRRGYSQGLLKSAEHPDVSIEKLPESQQE